MNRILIFALMLWATMMAAVDARQGFHDEFREYTPQNLAQSKKLKPLPPHNNRYSYFGTRK